MVSLPQTLVSFDTTSSIVFAHSSLKLNLNVLSVMLDDSKSKTKTNLRCGLVDEVLTGVQHHQKGSQLGVLLPHRIYIDGRQYRTKAGGGDG